MDSRYRIEHATPEHLPFLPAIERDAGRLFIGYGLPDSVFADATSAEELQEAQEDGLLWVAVGPERVPVGFALVDVVDGAAHLEEIDVHPDHGRRGIGVSLVRTVCDWAREAGYPAVTLTTFRDVPWNAPFYASLGFVAIPADRLGPVLSELLREEAERGLEPEKRVVMRRVLGDAR